MGPVGIKRQREMLLVLVVLVVSALVVFWKELLALFIMVMWHISKIL